MATKEPISIIQKIEECSEQMEKEREFFLALNTEQTICPLMYRINSILELVQSEDLKNSDIDWDYVNKVLYTNPIKFDYNINTNNVSSIEELKDLFDRINAAYTNKGNYFKYTCSTCKKDNFYDINQAISCLDSNDDIPIVCPECLEKNKG